VGLGIIARPGGEAVAPVAAEPAEAAAERRVLQPRPCKLVLRIAARLVRLRRHEPSLEPAALEGEEARAQSHQQRDHDRGAWQELHQHLKYYRKRIRTATLSSCESTGFRQARRDGCVVGRGGPNVAR